MLVSGLTFSILANFKLGRYLLLKYHRLFSFGFVTKKETKFEEMKDITFSFQFRGYGFDKKIEDKNVQFDTPPTKMITTELTGPEPGYIATAKLIVDCAMVLLKENDKISVRGGVLTTAAAFHNTSLIERLQNNGFKFRVIQSDA